MALQQLVRTEEDLVKKVSSSQIIDNWWTAEIMKKKYPILCKVAKVQVTIFHGAQVESRFSSMSRIITKQADILNITMLSAIQTVKYELSCSGLCIIKYCEEENSFTNPNLFIWQQS